MHRHRYVLQLPMVNHSEKCALGSLVELPNGAIWMFIVVLLYSLVTAEGLAIEFHSSETKMV